MIYRYKSFLDLFNNSIPKWKSYNRIFRIDSEDLSLRTAEYPIDNILPSDCRSNLKRFKVVVEK